MPHNWRKLAAAFGLILLASTVIQAAEIQVEKKTQTPKTELKVNKAQPVKPDRQQASDTQEKSWSNIKALWG